MRKLIMTAVAVATLLAPAGAMASSRHMTKHHKVHKHHKVVKHLKTNVFDNDGLPGPRGLQGLPGLNGVNGAQGPQGPKGDTGLAGAFFSVQQYPNGIGAGGVATVACDPNDATNSQHYVAISGGVQDTDNATDMSTINPLPIAASFPGRMDWSTNTPKPGRLDGWIVQMAKGDSSDTPASVWALCVPAANVGSTVVN